MGRSRCKNWIPSFCCSSPPHDTLPFAYSVSYLHVVPSCATIDPQGAAQFSTAERSQKAAARLETQSSAALIDLNFAFSKITVLQQAKARIPECFSSLEAVIAANESDKQLCGKMTSALHVFSAEIMVELGEWDDIGSMMQVNHHVQPETDHA